MIYGGLRRAVGLAASAYLLYVGSLWAEAQAPAPTVVRQVRPFLQSLQAGGYHLNFYRDGLQSVHAINFKDGVENQYQTFFNRIILSRSMNDGSGRIKPLSALGVSDFGTLGHESFHAYKANFLDVEKRFSHLKDFFQGRADSLYASLPESKRAVALEESYASFIGFILQAHASVVRSFGRIDEENCERTLKMLEKIWKGAWNMKVQGYYYRDSIGEYWSDQLKGLGILISQGRKAYEDFNGRDQSIYTDIDLESIDRRWIGVKIFESQYQENFAKTFSDKILATSCGSQVYPEIVAIADKAN